MSNITIQNQIYSEYIRNLNLSYSAKRSEDVKTAEMALKELEKYIFPNFKEILSNLSIDENLSSKIFFTLT